MLIRSWFRPFAPLMLNDGGGAPPTPPAPTPPTSPMPPAPPEPPEFKAPASQDELDRIVGERLARERAKFADYDDLKAKAAALDKLQEGEKSDLQKAQDAAAAAETQRVELEARFKASQINAAVIAAASKLGAVDPAAVAKLLDDDAVTIDNAGQVTGAETAVTKLLEASPYLKGKPVAPVPTGAGRRSAPGEASVKSGRDLFEERRRPARQGS